MSIAAFEVMRAATDRRNTVWAAALATHVRQAEADARFAVQAAILQLLESGDVTLARSAWGSDSLAPLSMETAEAALEDESQWHPRRLPWSKRLRIVATRQGADKFWAGEFGSPSPLDITIPAFERLEMQGLTCAEASGMAVGVLGFLAGSSLGFTVVAGTMPFVADAWSPVAVLGWMIGGAIGLTATLWSWHKRFTPTEADDLPGYVVPDQYDQGPDLYGTDAFGDPRF